MKETFFFFCCAAASAAFAGSEPALTVTTGISALSAKSCRWN